MSGCFKRLGCLVLLLVLLCVGVLAWWTRDRWYYRVRPDAARSTRASASDVVWEPLTPEGSDRARAAVQSLNQKSGPAFASTRPGDISSYVFTGLARQLPPSATDVRAAAIGDRLYIKALVNLSDFGGTKTLGPLAGFLSDRDTVQFGGNFEILRPGLAQYRVREVRFAQLAIPERLIPKLLARVRRGARPEGVSDDALPLVVPPYIADVRVAGGKVTLYKNVK